MQAERDRQDQLAVNAVIVSEIMRGIGHIQSMRLSQELQSRRAQDEYDDFVNKLMCSQANA